MIANSDLDKIGIKHGTDKSSRNHGYLDIYSVYMDHLRHEPIQLLEIGYGGYKHPMKGGESAKTWFEYFTKAKITILDIHPKKNVPEGIDFVMADATKPLPNSYAPDIVIDDGSHLSKDIISAFKNNFRILKSGGLWIVEDLHQSYDPYYRDSNRDPSKGETAMNFLKRLADQVNSDFIEPIYRLAYDIEFIHFYRELCIIKKK